MTDADVDLDEPTEIIRPPLDNRRLWLGTTVVIIGSGVVIALAGLATGRAVALCLVLGSTASVIGGFLAARATRVAVHLFPDTLHYIGYVRSVTIPRTGIDVVLDDASVEWHDAAGRQHRDQLGIFLQAWEDDGRATAPLWCWRRAGLLRVREWAGARSV